jgi:hypothetical protein
MKRASAAAESRAAFLTSDGCLPRRTLNVADTLVNGHKVRPYR